MVLKFSGNRLAVCTCSISMKLVSDAVIVGTKGTIKVRGTLLYEETVQDINHNNNKKKTLIQLHTIRQQLL